MQTDPMARIVAKVLKMPAGFLSFFIKFAQIMMLLAGLAAFLSGAYELGLDLWFSVKGVSVEGHVIGHEVKYETRESFPASSMKSSSSESEYTDVPVHRPTIRYRWPSENGEVYTHRSSIEFEGDEMDAYSIGNRVTIRVLPDAPGNARLSGGFIHYLWSAIGLVAGLAAVVLVSSLFFLHEALFGRDLSRGVLLFRSLNCPLALVVLVALTVGLQQFHQRVVPWVGIDELAMVATGEIRLLPPLLAAKGNPQPGQFLNEAERSFARLPWLGVAFASDALERALFLGDDASAQRYLGAMADPATTFPVRSSRLLTYGAERGKVDFVKKLLASGISPDTAPFSGWEPLRQAARRNHTEVMELLLAAGASIDYPNHPLICSALEGRSEDAARLLLERTKVDITWREPQTGTMADLALIQGMVAAAEQLKQGGSPVSLPGFYQYAVTGDLKGLGRELPRSSWKSAHYGDATLLHLAARHHQPALARQLVALGADPNAQIRGGTSEAYTPLIEAVLSGDTEIIRFLAGLPEIRLDRGDYRHITPLAYAIKQDRWDLAELLVEAGADVNIQVGDYNGNTPLHLVAEKGDLKRVEWLLAKGADSQMKNFRQLTPMDVASSSEVINLIQRGR